MRDGSARAVMRSVIQELGDRLVVSFRPRRAWFELAFLSFWLTLWSGGGLMAMTQLGHVGPGGTLFFLIWLTGWAFGECFVAGVIAWQFVGRTLLTVTADILEIRWEIRRLARTKQYELVSVEEISAAQVPADEDERPRSDFGLRIEANDETLHIGERLTASEAEYVASTVTSRIFAPRSWWGDENRPEHVPGAEAAPLLSAGRFQIAEPRAKVVGATVAAVVILSGTLLSAVFETREHTRHAEPASWAALIPRATATAGLHRSTTLRRRDDRIDARVPPNDDARFHRVRRAGDVDSVDVSCAGAGRNRSLCRTHVALHLPRPRDD